MSAHDKTNARLKAVLDVLAANEKTGKKLLAADVLALAITAVPLGSTEAEAHAGGVTRGEKALNLASAKLVKAGWLSKARSGWTLTDDGVKVAATLADGDALESALVGGAPVTAKAPAKAAPKAAAKAAAKAPEKAAEKAPAKAAAKAPAKNPAVKPVTAKAPATTASKTTAKAAPKAPKAAAAVVLSGQPESVAIAGDFNEILGSLANWEPSHDSAQMSLDKKQGIWKLSAELPAGFYSFKAAVNGSWEENYGAFGQRDGSNHEFEHAGGPVTFHYDHATHDVLRG